MLVRNFISLTLIFSTLFAALCVAGEDSQLDQALALTPDLASGEKTYMLCAACHGEDGLGLQAGEFPSIAGQHQSVILKQLFDIQQKKRINPSMFPFSDMETLGGLQGMVDVAAYTAGLPAGSKNIRGEGKDLVKGQSLFKSHCAACHGNNGQGDAFKFYPRLNHQHFPYLLRELGWIRDGIRKNADPAMVQILSKFSDQDIQAVADYLSRLE